jgi:hypothetical protein
MRKTLAIIHAPGATEDQKRRLVQKLRYHLDLHGFSGVRIRTNPKMPFQEDDYGKCWNTIVLGWGMPSGPTWAQWVCEHNPARFGQEFLVFDLFERRKNHGKILCEPRINAGSYWGGKIKLKNFQVFLDGYYLKPSAPYGMRRVVKNKAGTSPSRPRPHNVLVPGNQEDIEIVRLIFDLFVNHDSKRTKIANLLNVQSVKPPGKNARWSAGAVRAILENPAYIGANEYGGSIRFNVFPSIVNKSIFFEAQAKIIQESFTRKELHAMNREYVLSSQL